jgi:hypothetical protein
LARLTSSRARKRRSSVRTQRITTRRTAWSSCSAGTGSTWLPHERAASAVRLEKRLAEIVRDLIAPGIAWTNRHGESKWAYLSVLCDKARS